MPLSKEIWSEFKYKLLTEKVRLENLVPPIDNTDNEKKEESETMVSTPKLPIANAVDPVIKSNQDAAVMKQKPTDTTSQGQDMNGNSSGNHIDGRTNINANGGTLQQRGNTSSTLVNKPSSEKNDSVRKSLAHVVMGSSISRINTVNTSSSETKVTALKKSAARKLGVDEWWKRGCLRCTNCKREKCHKCAMCLSAASTNKDSDDDIEKWMPFRCYQKVNTTFLLNLIGKVSTIVLTKRFVSL